jgi:hypothetical protein
LHLRGFRGVILKYHCQRGHSEFYISPQFSHRQDSRRHDDYYGCSKFICAVPNIGVVVKRRVLDGALWQPFSSPKQTERTSVVQRFAQRYCTSFPRDPRSFVSDLIFLGSGSVYRSLDLTRDALLLPDFGPHITRQSRGDHSASDGSQMSSAGITSTS